MKAAVVVGERCDRQETFLNVLALFSTYTERKPPNQIAFSPLLIIERRNDQEKSPPAGCPISNFCIEDPQGKF